MIRPWRISASRTTHDDPWLKVRSDTCVRADGRLITPYHVLEYPDWVNVVALTPALEIVLVRQYRHATSEILLELPCGALASRGEDALSAAARELEEETGYVARELVEIGAARVNPASHTNTSFTALAIGSCRLREPRPDASEEIEVVVADLVGFVTRVVRGEQPLQSMHMASLWITLLWMARSLRPELEGLRQRLAECAIVGTRE
jgi:ADP-ribose pyrophosphatase